MSVLDRGGSCRDAAAADATSGERSAFVLEAAGDRATAFQRRLGQKLASVPEMLLLGYSVEGAAAEAG